MFMRASERNKRGGSVLKRVGAALMAVLMTLETIVAARGCAPQPALAAAPDSITVASVDPYPNGLMDGGGFTSHRYTDPNGNVLYCADADAGTPVVGQTFTGRKEADTVLDYILWHGYGGTGDEGWSQAATQVAIWEHLYVIGDGLNTEGWQRQKQAWPEGKRLYDEAVANASPSGSYVGTGWIYGEASKACQRVVGQTVRTGSLAIEKASANPSLSDGNAAYSLEGAVLGVYSDAACTNEVTRLTTDASGQSSADGLALGTYWVREISAPHGYALSSEVYEATVGVTGVTVHVGEPPQNDPLLLSLAKSDAETGKNTAQGAASLAGAEFTVRYYAGTYGTVDALPAEATRTWVLKTDVDGRTSLVSAASDPATYYAGGDAFYTDASGTATLPLGTVTVRETKAPEGYLLDDTVHLRQITASGATEHVSSEALPTVPEQVIRGGVSVQKLDRELASAQALGAATLEGAVIELTNTSPAAVLVDGREVSPGEVAATLVTNKEGYAATAADLLPYGTYQAREVQAPEGYLPNDAWAPTVAITQDDVIVPLEGPEAGLADQVRRGDLRLVKAEEGSQQRMAHIPFSLTSLTTGESHVLATDENGMLDTGAAWVSHRTDTNANDAALREDGTVDDDALTPQAGTWFSGSAERTTEPDDALGALPYDTYELAELACTANEGHRLVSTRATISRHGTNLDLGTMDDEQIEKPSLDTTLSREGEKDVPAEDGLALTDEVTYRGLVPGQAHTLEGELHLVSEEPDGTLVDQGIVASATQELTCSEAEGTLSVAFEANTSELAGQRLVAFETVYDRTDTAVAEHRDLSDEGQTVTVTPPEEEPELAAPAGPEADAPHGPVPNTGEPAPVVATVLAAAGLGLLGLVAFSLLKGSKRPTPPTPGQR